MSKHRNNKQQVKIPDDAKRLAKLSFKKFKKEEGDYYDSKKELKQAYFSEIVELLPRSIALLVNYGNREEVKEIKSAIYDKITNEDFLKYLRKEIKNGEDFDNLILLPNLIYDIVAEAEQRVIAEKEENPDKVVELDVDDLTDLSRVILKKKIKKLQKIGIDENVALQIASIFPSAKILDKSGFYHLRRLFKALYQSASKTTINFEKLANTLFKNNEDYLRDLVLFALLERKEKINSFNDKQKDLFTQMTQYCLQELENLKKDDIRQIIENYIKARKRDDSQNKDAPRRFALGQLPEKEYPKIAKVVDRIKDNDKSTTKFF